MIGLRRALVGLGVGGFVAGLLSLVLLLPSDNGDQVVLAAVSTVVIGWSFIGTGLFAWYRRPANRIGALMTAVGFAWLVQAFFGSDNRYLFAIGAVFGAIAYAPLIQMLVTYPEGRVTTRLQRWVVIGVWIDVVVFQLLSVPFLDPHDFPDCDRCPENFLLVSANRDVVNAIAGVQTLFAAAVIAGVIVELRRRWQATPTARRAAMAPVMYAGGLTLVAEVIVLSTSAAGVRHGIVAAIYLVALVILASVPYAFLAGLLRSRLSRAGAVSDLVARLNESARGRGRRTLRDALAEALGDPTLELVYWLPDRERYVDAAGQPVDLPAPGSGRAWSAVTRDGVPVGALVHAPALVEDRDLVEAVGAAAGLALENERLDAELRARVEELRASRERLIEVGLAERRALERNLHDGAQQRLVALALSLRLTRGKLDEDPAAAGELLEEAMGELDAATKELRELARGIHPAVLSDRGLRAALEALAGRAPVAVEILETPSESLPTSVEAVAYYVVAEALTNMAKYADAQAAQVRVTRDNGAVVIQVSDDGVGGADPAGGSGLRGLADRLAGVDGRLDVQSPRGAGTTIRAEIPVD